MNQYMVHRSRTAVLLDRSLVTGEAQRTFQKGLVTAITTLNAELSQNGLLNTALAIDYL